MNRMINYRILQIFDGRKVLFHLIPVNRNNIDIAVPVQIVYQRGDMSGSDSRQFW